MDYCRFRNNMKKINILGALFALVLVGGLAGPVWANEGSSEGNLSNYACNQDPVYSCDFNGQTTISSRLRTAPCMDASEVIRVLDKGKIVKVIAEMDGWYQIKDTDGKTGWVGAALIKETESSLTATASAPTTAASTNLVSRLKGYILLQVENNGEAWYVNPVNSFRYFLKDGDTAYSVMRNMGLGVSNANLEKLKSKEKTLVDRLKGRIVLQVEKNGEAFYVNPKTGALSYLKNGFEAYKVMRNLSLGIKNDDLNKISSADVEEYNHENPVYPGDDYHYLTDANVRSDFWSSLKAGTYYFRVCEYLGGKCGVYSNNLKLVVTEAVSSGSITLSGSINSEDIAAVNWSLKDMTSSMGFKVVVADHENPVYPGDEYHYLSNANTRADSWGDLSGTKYFRVCEYLGGKCGVYSNNLKLVF